MTVFMSSWNGYSVTF